MGWQRRSRGENYLGVDSGSGGYPGILAKLDRGAKRMIAGRWGNMWRTTGSWAAMEASERRRRPHACESRRLSPGLSTRGSTRRRPYIHVHPASRVWTQPSLPASVILVPAVARSVSLPFVESYAYLSLPMLCNSTLRLHDVQYHHSPRFSTWLIPFQIV